MTMKTSCTSPPQWSNRDQRVSTPAATKPSAWVVSSRGRVRDLVFAGPKMGFRHKGSPVWCPFGVSASAGRYRQRISVITEFLFV